MQDAVPLYDTIHKRAGRARLGCLQNQIVYKPARPSCSVSNMQAALALQPRPTRCSASDAVRQMQCVGCSASGAVRRVQCVRCSASDAVRRVQCVGCSASDAVRRVQCQGCMAAWREGGQQRLRSPAGSRLAKSSLNDSGEHELE